jgi:hypothetical protein
MAGVESRICRKTGRTKAKMINHLFIKWLKIGGISFIKRIDCTIREVIVQKL